VGDVALVNGPLLTRFSATGVTASKTVACGHVPSDMDDSAGAATAMRSSLGTSSRKLCDEIVERIDPLEHLARMIIVWIQ